MSDELHWARNVYWQCAPNSHTQQSYSSGKMPYASWPWERMKEQVHPTYYKCDKTLRSEKKILIRLSYYVYHLHTNHIHLILNNNGGKTDSRSIMDEQADIGGMYASTGDWCKGSREQGLSLIQLGPNFHEHSSGEKNVCKHTYISFISVTHSQTPKTNLIFYEQRATSK